MTPEEMKKRAKEFAKRVIAVCRQLPATEEARLIRGKLCRAGTAVGANYRAAWRGRSKPDFISKLGITLEEADESLYWLEIIAETGILKLEAVSDLMDEARQLIAIFVSGLNT